MDFLRLGIGGALASVIGSHHGVPAEQGHLSMARGRLDLVGAGLWGDTRKAMLRRATERIGGTDVLHGFQQLTLSLPSQVLLSAIVILADWIASNDDLFPLWPLSTLRQPPAPDEDRTARRLAEGWEQLDLPPRWTPQPMRPDLNHVVQIRFGLKGAHARPVQVAAVRAATEQPTPRLLIVEAAMGEGKTEAALLAAEILALRSGADGCFVALPTQATSDAMFERVTRWLENLPGRADQARLSVRLAHGKAHLNDTFDGLVREGKFGSVGDGGHDALVAHQWLSGRKKAVLASFIVGTIDQVLFAALRSRHLMLRHLALAGKVVVIDEVHAYDVYVSQYLHRVLHWLGVYQVPVVLLSATLPPERRAALVAAYDSGREPSAAELDQVGAAVGYPMVSGSGITPRVVSGSGLITTVVLDHLPDDIDTLVAYLRTPCVPGGGPALRTPPMGRLPARAVSRGQRTVRQFQVIVSTQAGGPPCFWQYSRADWSSPRRRGVTVEPTWSTLHIHRPGAAAWEQERVGRVRRLRRRRVSIPADRTDTTSPRRCGALRRANSPLGTSLAHPRRRGAKHNRSCHTANRVGEV